MLRSVRIDDAAPHIRQRILIHAILKATSCIAGLLRSSPDFGRPLLAIADRRA